MDACLVMAIMMGGCDEVGTGGYVFGSGECDGCGEHETVAVYAGECVGILEFGE